MQSFATCTNFQYNFKYLYLRDDFFRNLNFFEKKNIFEINLK